MFGNQIKKYLVSVLIFLLPTQLAYHFWPEYAFIFGIRVDYLSPAIYLTDLLILVLIIFRHKLLLKHSKLFLWILLFALVNTFFSSLPFVSLYKWLKVVELVMLATVIKKESITKPLYYSLIFYSVIGIMQFLIGRTTGLFYLLGERSFDINTPAIALVEIFGQNFMRAYSTFPHPNALAGYLGLSTIFLLHKKYKFNWLFLFVILSFTLTFSLSVFIGIVIYLLFKSKFNNYFIFLFLILSLLLPLTPYHSQFTSEVSERLTLAIESATVITDNFWAGSGLGTFVKLSSIRQPVHNLFLLIFAELGIVGLLMSVYLLFKNSKKYAFLLFVLTVGLFDHYFLTIQQDILLLTLLFALW